jgi:HEAT repeat protein
MNYKLIAPKLLFCVCGLLAVCGCSEPAPKSKIENRKLEIESLVPEAVRIIEEALADNDPAIKVNAIEVVAATQQAGLMPKVERLLSDEFVPVRFAAALAVGDTRYRFASESVKQLLKDRDENVRIAAAYALAKLGYADSFGLVHRAITSKDQTIRANAALILGKTGDPCQLELLDWALSDKDSDDKVMFQVAEAMAMLKDGRVYPKLWAMLISAYADDRVIGIRAMGALGTEQAKNALITMLDDKVLEVRLAAAEQLGVLGETTEEREVLEVFTKNLTAGLDKKELESVNTLTALAIGQIRTAAVTKFLPQLLNDESKFVRIAAVKAVFQCTMRNRTAEKSSI